MKPHAEAIRLRVCYGRCRTGSSLRCTRTGWTLAVTVAQDELDGPPRRRLVAARFP